MIPSKKDILFSLFFILPFFCISQNNIPYNKTFTKAVTKETRTIKGIPGSNYWQNSASYDISAEVFPLDRKLSGEEKIYYVNNSPDTLNQLVFHIFQNLYKKGSKRDLLIHPDDVHSGVVIEHLKINNTLITNFTLKSTRLIVDLDTPLLPSTTTTIEMSWNFPIPVKSDIRMGGKDETSFFLGHWFPKVAVYDDIKGWDQNTHTGSKEFYADLGNYKFSIKVPADYIVWGSGILQNPKSVLSGEIYNRYKLAQKSDSIITIVGSEDHLSGKQLTKNNIWKFEANDVPDVAFGFSDHYLWDGTSLKGASDKNIFIDAAYPPESKDFSEVAFLAKEAIAYLSTELPGYPFPFPAMTIFNGTNGRSGMEYPMIVNNPSSEFRGRTVDVTAHEIAHNYFPFYVLTNETEHAWMDEGFSAMIPYDFQLKTDPELNRLTRYAKTMSRVADSDQNVALASNSNMVGEEISSFNFYAKPAIALYVLQDVLGEKLFKKCMLTYIETWKGKHPVPPDFFHLVNETSNQNLNWFWKAWFFEKRVPDLSIDKVDISDGEISIIIKKVGDLPVPLDLLITFKDETTEHIHYSAATWEDSHTITIAIKTVKKVDHITLGNDYIPDVNKANNFLIVN
jgi:hypothetical protein